jgi:zinc finger protein
MVNDPSGNSHIKNPYAPHADPLLKIENYERTKEQLSQMGFDVENSIINQAGLDANPITTPPQNNTNSTPSLPKEKNEETKADGIDHPKKGEHLLQVGAHRLDFTKPLVEDLKSESFKFTTDCYACTGVSETKMCVIEIPYFKELIIMSSICTKCGARTAETKTGGYLFYN